MAVTEGTYSPDAARQALDALQKAKGGALTLTNGLSEVRLVVEAKRVSAEAQDVVLAGREARDLIRIFLCTVFWEEATYLLDTQGEPLSSAQAIRVSADPVDLLNQIKQGLGELASLRERVGDLGIVVTVSGHPPPPDVDTPSARLFRALETSPKGDALGTAAEKARLDAIDAVWAVADLVEAGQATVKRPPPTAAHRRLKRAEAVADFGLIPGLRYTHLARGQARVEPKRSAQFYRQAGDAYVASGKYDAASASFQSCLAVAQDDVPAREGMLRALDGLGKPSEAKRYRAELAEIYLTWGFPARARAHLQVLSEPSVEKQDVLLECMIRMRDFPAALELAGRLAPMFDGPGRVALAERFGAQGAGRDVLDAAIALSGVRALRPVKRGLLLLDAVLLVACLALGAEAWVRVRYRAASDRVRAALSRRDMQGLDRPFAELAELAGRVAPPGSCLRAVAPLRARLVALQRDHERFAAQAALFQAPRSLPDTAAALAGLEALAAEAQTDALRGVIADQRARIVAYHAEVEAAVRDLEADVNRAIDPDQYRRAFQRARDLVRTYANARSLYANLPLVALWVRVYPVEALVYFDDRPVRVLGRVSEGGGRREWGTREIRLALDPSAGGVLRFDYARYVRQTREVRFETLESPEIRVELVQTQPIHDDEVTWPSVASWGPVYVGGDTQLRALRNILDANPTAPRELEALADATFYERFSGMLRPGYRLRIELAPQPNLVVLNVLILDASGRRLVWQVKLPPGLAVTVPLVEEAIRVTITNIQEGQTQ